MKMICWYLLCIALASNSANADQFQVPTDNDLKANYCLAVDKFMLALESKPKQISESMKNDPKMQKALREDNERITKTEYDISHLKAYIASRIMSVDPMPLQIAYQSGEDDINQLTTFIDDPQERRDQDACMQRKCNSKIKSEYGKCLVDSISGCSEETAPDRIKAISAKVKRCRDLSWMPF